MAANRKLIAVLIDGDNAQAELVPLILEEMKQYGNPQIKRVYGDWSGSLAKNWQSIVTRYAIETKHRFNSSAGKNATDIALVIDAMDILRDYEDDLHGFCIVSSDSDFSHLATRIRQSGLIVIGVGRERSVPLFKDSFDHFIPIESLTKRLPEAAKAAEPPSPADTAPPIGLDEFGKWFAQGYKNVMARGEFDPRLGVQLRDVRDEMMKLVPNLPSQFQLMPAFVAQTKALSAAYPNYLIINGVPEDRPLLHYAQILFPNDQQAAKTKTAKTKAVEPAKPAAVKAVTPPPAKPTAVKAVTPPPAKPAAVKSVTTPLPPEIDVLMKVYRIARDELKLAADDGWLLVSHIGTIVRERFPKHDPSTYKGEKHAKLTKVMAKMAQDYPHIVEVKQTGTIHYVRVKS